MRDRFVAYYRVSTSQQGRSGLGLDAQKQAINDYLSGGPWELLTSFTEVESGKVDSRPELANALAECRRLRACLLIAKLDRLGRRLSFIANLMDSGVDFKAADMPHADRFRLHLEAVIAEDERRRISERTKAALAAAKRRGVKLGAPSPKKAGLIGAATVARQADQRASNVVPLIREVRRAGVTTMAGIAQALNARGVASPRGRGWGASQVWRVLQRTEPA